MILRLRHWLERFGRSVWPVFSGVIIVEAQKRLYQGLPVAARASRRVFVPVLAPHGVPSTRVRSPELKAPTAPRALSGAQRSL
ncbi:hypothetical protein ABIA13_000808 [Sinorhizobium fredii]